MSKASGTAESHRTATKKAETTTRTTSSVMVAGKDGRLPWEPRKVWLFAALPLMLAVLAIGTPWAVDHIEDQLVAETASDLESAGIDTSELDIDFDYRDGEVVGILPSGASVAGIENAVDAPLLRDLDVRITESPLEPAEIELPVDVADLGWVDVASTQDAGVITLTGTVLTQGHRNQLVEAAAGVVGAENVRDDLTVSGLEPSVEGVDERVAALASTLGAAAPTDQLFARLSVTSLSVLGEVGSDETLGAVEAAVGASGLDGNVDLIVGDPAEVTPEQVGTQIDDLQASLDALNAEIRENVTFQTSSTVLNDSAQATLDKVVTLMNDYELPVVEVVGHTDSQGGNESNRTLSQGRADSVAAYLAANGVDASRVQARGAGEDEPIASNLTPEGRAENRRVQLVALPAFS